MSYWLQQTYYDSTNGPSVDEENVAVRQIGTNAIPSLLQMLRAYDPPLKARFLAWATQHRFLLINHAIPKVVNERACRGFFFLGPTASNAVPELIKIVNENISISSQCDALLALGYIGPKSRIAVPTLLQLTTNTNQTVRACAIWSLGDIHADPDTVVPVLILGLSDRSDANLRNVAHALGSFKGDAKPAVPALVELLTDSNLNVKLAFPPAVGIELQDALQQIDPETYARVVTNAAPGSSR